MPNHQRVMPTRDQLRVWREYIETAEALRSRLTAKMQADSELSSGDYQVLLALNEADDRSLRSSELAAQVGWERSRLSHHLGRMEKRRLVARRSCTDVAHGVDVILTDAGVAAFRRGSVPHLRAVRELFIDAFTAEQLEQVDALTAALRAHLQLDTPDHH